jgi:hypothetical protein
MTTKIPTIERLTGGTRLGGTSLLLGKIYFMTLVFLRMLKVFIVSAVVLWCTRINRPLRSVVYLLDLRLFDTLLDKLRMPFSFRGQRRMRLC